MEFELLIQASVPVWLVKDSTARRPGWNAELYPQITRDEFSARLPLFRGVPPDRFLTVLATGVDVTPTDRRRSPRRSSCRPPRTPSR